MNNIALFIGYLNKNMNNLELFNGYFQEAATLRQRLLQIDLSGETVGYFFVFLYL